MPVFAASYATECGLKVTALVPEYGRLPEAAALEKRDGELVRLADAAVVVWSDREPSVRRLLALVEAKGIPVHVRGSGEPPPRTKPVEEEEVPRERRGLPD